MSSLSELLPDRGAATDRILLRELSHRVSDELASAIRLVTFAADRCDSGEARIAIVEALDRLQNHAFVHHSLQMPEFDTSVDMAAYLHQLCRSVSRARLAGAGIELSLSVYPLRMAAGRCWLVGMIVFELIANAAHRDFADRAGAIRLEIWPVGGSIECRMSDNGRSDEDPLQKGLATVAALAISLEGTVESQFEPGGRRTIVKIPID